MKTKLIEVGDKLLLRDKYLLYHNIPFENRECEVIYYDKECIVVKNDLWGTPDHSFSCGGDIDNFFIIINSINYELLQLINSDIQFVSFMGTTTDGKKISVSS